MAGRHQWVPDLFTWAAHDNLKDGIHQIEYKTAPDADVDSNEHEHITFPIGDENPKVLEENGELDEEDHRRVDNC